MKREVKLKKNKFHSTKKGNYSQFITINLPAKQRIGTFIRIGRKNIFVVFILSKLYQENM